MAANGTRNGNEEFSFKNVAAAGNGSRGSKLIRNEMESITTIVPLRLKLRRSMNYTYNIRLESFLHLYIYNGWTSTNETNISAASHIVEADERNDRNESGYSRGREGERERESERGVLGLGGRKLQEQGELRVGETTKVEGERESRREI
uniref:Uncharacterized protein n=1 Tax=Nelumbo nucifera TaxID=4432 RepID=A0A822XMX1_NELNU|nr:TPA_asm: hypothetical protein HUJ06_022506 [Nelumbo nucifera]